MDIYISRLDCENPEKRVLEWLKQCRAAPRDEEHGRDERGSADVIHGSKLTTGIHLIDNLSEQSEQCSVSRQTVALSTIQKRHSNAKCKKWSETDSGCLSASTVFRQYTFEENQQIIKYIVENDAFPFLKGTLLWQKMEKDKICYRSWQSMKSQFITKIYPNINEYLLEDGDKEKLREYMKPSKQIRFIHMMPGQRGWRKNGKYYTVEEDILILKYIRRKRRHLNVHGNTMWQTMEDRQILPGRTWQSMRSRYLNVIRHSLDIYELKEPGIGILVNSKKNDLSPKKNQNLNMPPPAPVSPCTNIKRVCKKSAYQELRKYAFCTSAQLASNLKLIGEKASENGIETDKEVHHTSVQREAPDIEMPPDDDHDPSERNPNEINRKCVEYPNTCVGSNMVPDSQKHDVALADVSMKESHNATQILVENTLDENSQSERNNSKEFSLLSCVTQNESMKEKEMFVENNSTIGNTGNGCNDSRSDIEYAMPSVISDLQESLVSVNKNFDNVNSMVNIEKNTIEEVNSISHFETHNKTSDCEGSFCSRETVERNTSYCHDDIVNNCKRCSADHKLSPSSN